VGLVLGPTHETTRIAAVRIRALDKWKANPRARQDAFGSITGLDVGPMHLDGEQPSVGIGQNVALTTLNLLANIIALRSPF